ncbi:MAG TPA: carboxypeptidase-like regulatory domain-containing protein, partial [Planctomycetota bacterium]|nr:carboxypeptidase-like regulatory domain-containing protein [Planctomycetota bacterium]
QTKADLQRLIARFGTDLGRRIIYTTKTRAPDGIAPIPRIPRPLPGMNPSSFVVVSLLIPGLEVADQRVDLDHLPTDPIKFVLPEHGSVVVLTRDLEGKPVSASHVELLDDAQLKDGHWDAELERAVPATVIESGRATFPFVALGLDLSVDGISNGRGASAQGKGPRVAGEQVTIELIFGLPTPLAAHPVLLGRVVDEQGRPLGQTAFVANINARGGGNSAFDLQRFTTSPEGRFRVVMPVGAAADFSGEISLGRNIGATGAQEIEARFLLDSRIHEGENEIGDLVLRSPQCLAAGRVVDDTGAPVPNALVDGDVLQEFDGQKIWKNDSRLAGKAAADGTFTIVATIPAGRIRLRASRRGWVDGENADFVPGATNVWITLTRSSRIEGHVLLDDVGASTSFWIRAARKSDSSQQHNLFRDREKTRVKPDGSFLLPDVRPGSTDLAIFVENVWTDVLVLEGLKLSPGETSNDPRLGAIDLRGKIVPAPPQEKRD